MELTQVIQQRKTIKAFDRNVKISRAELEEMLNLAQLAPSKANLQPWRFMVLDSPEQKSLLNGKVAFNELPCETASAVILILADLHYPQLLGDILDLAVEKGCLHPATRQNSFEFLSNMHHSQTPQQIRDQVLIDSSLVSMQLMLIAKDRGFDSHAIGIFEREAVLNSFNLDAERYVPVMILAIGKAAAQPIPSVRLPLDYTLAYNGEPFKK